MPGNHSSLTPQLPLEASQSATLRACAACRQCEAYCAVFPALATRDADRREADVALLSHLCHDCGCCREACQYADPHPFAVDMPASLFPLAAAARKRLLALPLPGSFVPAARTPHDAARHAWFSTIAAALVCVALVFGAALALNGPETLFTRHLGSGAFYEVLPRTALMLLFPLAALAIATLWGWGAVRLWRELGANLRGLRSIPSHYRAIKVFLQPQGSPTGVKHGALPPELGFSGRRRFFRHVVGYGVLLVLLAFILGFIEENFMGRYAPFPLLSGPVVVASLGALLVIAGSCVLLSLRSPQGERGGASFVFLLLLLSLSGLALIAFYETHAMGSLLCLHVGLLLALFTRLPFAEGADGFFRYIAALRFIQERRRA
ncbi:hypothetical protein LJC23_03235 [Desulfovibrio sp. OttesenSCG-928-I05]|nr:hypothetical protein [Desulfovibrio sp. OttesenSCG-928-I05]